MDNQMSAALSMAMRVQEWTTATGVGCVDRRGKWIVSTHLQHPIAPHVVPVRAAQAGDVARRGLVGDEEVR